MSQAQFTIPLITVIPGQLITALLWNNEYFNLQTNLNPMGIGGYSDTDAQMQIQTAPYPGSVTNHATNVGGELERIRFQIAAICGNTYWYQTPSVGLYSVSQFIFPVGGIMDYPSASLAPGLNPAYWHLADGTALNRITYASLFSLIGTAFGIGDGSTTFNIPNLIDRIVITAGNLYALAATGGAVSSTPAITITDPGHNHTQNSHTHTMANHTHSTPNHTHILATTGGNLNNTTALTAVVSNGGVLGIPSGGGTSAPQVTPTTTSGGSSTTGTPSTNTNDATTATNQSNTTGVTASSASVSVLPPYMGLYKWIRVL